MRQLLFSSSFFLLSCPFFYTSASSLNKPIPCVITIFIHGTLKPAKFSLSVINTILRDKIEKSLYEKMIFNLRKTQYLYQSQPMQGIGLIPINKENENSKIGAHCMEELFEKQYNFYNSKPRIRFYYTFGWSGLLSIEKRKEEGENFYRALKQEVARLRSQGYEPLINIHAYSYGGAVALNLAAAKENDTEAASFFINQLVLLAMPVQKETDYLTADSDFFKKIYHIYSTEDNVQASDLFSTQKELFSRHIFTARHNFHLPKNLIQVRFRLTKRVAHIPTHISPNNILQNPSLLFTKRMQRVHMDPGHTEFWNLGWGDSWYRKEFPLNPLPVIALVPSITHLLQTYASDTPCITFDYCPLFNAALLIPCNQKKGIAVTLLNKKLLQELKDRGSNCMPNDYTLENRRYEEFKALQKAHEELKNNKRLEKANRQKLKTSYLFFTRKIGADFFPNVQKVRHAHLLRTKVKHV